MHIVVILLVILKLSCAHVAHCLIRAAGLLLENDSGGLLALPCVLLVQHRVSLSFYKK